MITAHPASYSEVAEELGIRRQTVTDLVDKLGLTWKPIRTNRKAKGLDPTDVRRIRRALGMTTSRATA